MDFRNVEGSQYSTNPVTTTLTAIVFHFFPIFFFQYSVSINQSSVLQQKHINTKSVRKFLIGLRKQFLTSHLLVQNHLERILNQDDLMIFLILVHHTQHKFYLLFQLNHNLQSTSKEHKLMKKYFKSPRVESLFFCATMENEKKSTNFEKFAK